MRLTEYEKQARREVEKWRYDEASIIQQLFDWAMRPLDWLVAQVVPEDLIDQVRPRPRLGQHGLSGEVHLQLVGAG